MFGKKKSQPKKNHAGKNLSQYGLFDQINPDMSYDEGATLDDEGDSDLEAELLALSTGGGSRPKRPARKPAPTVNLDSMIAESMKDIPSDEEISGDENDPDLLNELSEITGEEEEAKVETPVETAESNMTVFLQERMKMYETAERNAKAAGETSRARRFTRGIRTLKDLIKQATNGQPINNDDIPPEVAVNIRKEEPTGDVTEENLAPPKPVRTAPPPPTVQPQEPETPATHVEPAAQQEVPEKVELTEENKKLIELFTQRRNEYRNAAILAKKAGDTETALTYVKVVKAFEAVIKAVEAGQTVDLSDMPGPPPPYQPKIEENTIEKHQDPTPPEIPDDEPQAELITANSLEEALEQRLDVYRKQEEAAKEQGNSSKARRMGRIVKQFEQALKAVKSGKPVSVDDLPTPPGYAPLPVPGGAAPKPPVPAKPISEPKQEEDTPQPAPSPSKPSPPKRPAVSRVSGNHVPTTRAEKQLVLLLERQKEFKLAALAAKKKGELDQAKEFLRTAKGFDPLIEASQDGLPVDITSLPVPPSARSQLDNEYELVMTEECTEDDNTDRDVLTRLESQLSKQLKMCLTTRDHNKAIGDVAGTNRFEQLALAVSKDLDLIRLAKRTPNVMVPKFHYETKNFAIVKTFTELNDNDFELTIVRGINYNCTNPKEIDTYVKFDFPYPPEEGYKERTSTVKNTNNPEYDAKYVIPIQRSVRNCLRVFKRHSIKLEVYSKGGFFRSDTLIGTVTVKLQPLETQCEIHDSFDLMDGRKKTGGKLEVKMRVRNPLVNKQVEQISEKWLIIDQ